MKNFLILIAKLQFKYEISNLLKITKFVSLNKKVILFQIPEMYYRYSKQ